VNNSDILDLLLEGAAATKPGIRYLYNDVMNIAFLQVKDVHTTCALGAIQYGQAVRSAQSIIPAHSVLFPNDYDKALLKFKNDYLNYYDTTIAVDNDNFDRDFVIRRAKEMVNEQESSS
jgi:hypothetical protein